MTYSESLDYLCSLAQFGWKLDLERIVRLCELAGEPQDRFKSLLVGGSAGKGSTSSLISAILRAGGSRVGLAPKPHLVTHRERIQINGRLITEGRFASGMTAIVPLMEQVKAELGAPTVFECLTLLAFGEFARAAVDFGVVEVGLGGRFDATNVLTPEVSVITMIGLDHTDRLGDTVEAIAGEKAGIIKSGIPVVTGAQGSALEVIEAAARECGCEIWRLGHEIRLDRVDPSPNGSTFDLSLPGETYAALRVPLVGEHQVRNAALAVAAASLLGRKGRAVDPEAVRRGMARTRMSGRLQKVLSKPLLLLDGAHSPDRAEALATALQMFRRPGRRFAVVLALTAGHEPGDVVRALAPVADRIYATRSRHPSALKADQVAALARDAGCDTIVEPNAAAALSAALEWAQPQDAVVVTGSLFLVGEALSCLGSLGRV